jgi:hypothetical protein
MAQGRSPSGHSLQGENRYNKFRYNESHLYIHDLWLPCVIRSDHPSAIPPWPPLLHLQGSAPSSLSHGGPDTLSPAAGATRLGAVHLPLCGRRFWKLA